MLLSVVSYKDYGGRGGGGGFREGTCHKFTARTHAVWEKSACMPSLRWCCGDGEIMGQGKDMEGKIKRDHEAKEAPGYSKRVRMSVLEALVARG